MNRRGFMSALGLGAAAPTLVSTKSMTAWASTAGDTPLIKDAAELWDPVKQLSEAKREYERVTGDPSAWIADYVARELDEYHSGYSSFRFEYIDPDIRNMKSLSETTKIRMHFERKAKRRYESSKNSLFERIEQLLKEV